MATFVAIGSATGTASPLSIPVGTAAAIGDLVTVVMGDDTATGTVAVTDSKGNTYTQDAGPTGAASDGVKIFRSVLTTALTTSDTISVAATGTTFIAAGAIKLPSPHATPLAKATDTRTFGATATWDTWSTPLRWTDTLQVVGAWESTGATTAARTNTPEADWTEVYDLNASSRRALAILASEAPSGEVDDVVGGGGVWNSATSIVNTWTAAASYKKTGATQASTDFIEHAGGSPSFTVSVQTFSSYPHDSTGGDQPEPMSTYGQGWPL